MQGSQWKWISFGVVSILGLGYCFKSFDRQQQEYKRKLQEFRQVYEDSEKNKDKTLKQIMANKGQQILPKEKNVCLFFLKSEYNPQTFKLFERQRSVFANGPRYDTSDVLEHQMGGQFKAITTKKEVVKCKLNDFNVSGYLLTEQKTNVHLFKGKNQIQPIVCSVVTTLSPFLAVSIYGKLYFDNDTLQWTMEPSFLTRAFGLRETVENFYKQKLQIVTLYKFAILIGGLVLGYFALAKPLISFIKRKKVLIEQRAIQNQLQYFKNKEYLIVKGQSLLNCEICKKRSVEIAYECGHLALCSECHQNNLSRDCPLCKQKSTKFMRIFMA